LDIKVNFLDISDKYRRLSDKFIRIFKESSLEKKLFALEKILRIIDGYKKA